MATITITIDLPEGVGFAIEGGPRAEQDGAVEPHSAEDVERYWHDYLSDNGRDFYAAAAAIERESGPGFTLNDVAERMGVKYGSAQSIHRTSGRSARRWTDDTRDEAPPIRLDWISYDWDDAEQGMRTSYEMPEGVAAQIERLRR